MDESYQFIVLLLIVGCAVGFGLVYYTHTLEPQLCAAAGDASCAQYLQSPYASMLGVKLTWYGLFGFSITGLGSILMFAWKPGTRRGWVQKSYRRDPIDAFRVHLPRYLTFVLMIGALFSFIHIFIQMFIIRAICYPCMWSGGITIILSLVVYYAYRQKIIR